MKKRKGKFRKNRLKLKDGNRISLPSGQWRGICWEAGAGQGAAVPRDWGLSLETQAGLQRAISWKDWPAEKLPYSRGVWGCD